MSTRTTNYNFIKPELTDAANITVMNNNWDKIDTELEKKLSTSGGTLTGNAITFLNGYGKATAGNGFMQLESYKVANDTNNRRVLAVNSNSDIKDGVRLLDHIDGVSKTYYIHGEHNKPSGTYNGNGSDTSRTITIGGTGNLLSIISSTGILCFAFPWGALSFATNGTPTWYPSSEVMFTNGVLTLKSNANGFNKSGTTYNYQVL